MLISTPPRKPHPLKQRFLSLSVPHGRRHRRPIGTVPDTCLCRPVQWAEIRNKKQNGGERTAGSIGFHANNGGSLGV